MDTTYDYQIPDGHPLLNSGTRALLLLKGIASKSERWAAAVGYSCNVASRQHTYTLMTAALGPEAQMDKLIAAMQSDDPKVSEPAKVEFICIASASAELYERLIDKKLPPPLATVNPSAWEAWMRDETVRAEMLAHNGRELEHLAREAERMGFDADSFADKQLPVGLPKSKLN